MRPCPPRRCCKHRAAKPQPKRKPAPFRNRRGKGHALQAPAQPDHEPQIQTDVEPVHPQLQHQHRARMLLRNEPARDAKKRNRGRRGPDTHRHVLARQPLNLRTGRRDLKRRPKQRALQGDNHHACPQTDHHGTGQHRGHLVRVALPLGLRREAHGPHAQKPEHPVKRRQDHRTDAHGANRGGQPHLSHNACINSAKDRHSGIGQHHRDRNIENAAVAQPLGSSVTHAGQASQNAPSLGHKGGRGCPATPPPAPKHSAAPPV